MRLCKLRLSTNDIAPALIDGQHMQILRGGLSDFLHAPSPVQAVQRAIDTSKTIVPLEQAKLLAPIDDQEVWAAGVTYKRSQEARERESAGAARFYDLVYSAPRPSCFSRPPPIASSIPARRSTSAATASGTSPSRNWPSSSRRN